MPATDTNQLGSYLRDRRGKLDPATLGFPLQRRRTPGLRREEVAQRAHVSATWYTWLEQGRGGSPSADVLERIARALMLTTVEREHLFLLALGRPPEIRYQPTEGISPRLQRILDSLETSPAMVKTITWDVVAWNRAASAVFGYDTLLPEQRNILRRIFLDPQIRALQTDWNSVARFVVGAFRADVARAGTPPHVQSLIDELRRRSPEFDTMWRDNDVRTYGEGTKQLRHPVAGLLSFEYSAFHVDGRPDLGLVIYHPTSARDIDRIRRLMKSLPKPKAFAPAKPKRKSRRAARAK